MHAQYNCVCDVSVSVCEYQCVLNFVPGVTVQSSSVQSTFKRGSFSKIARTFNRGAVMVGDDKNCIWEAIKIQIQKCQGLIAVTLLRGCQELGDGSDTSEGKRLHP